MIRTNVASVGNAALALMALHSAAIHYPTALGRRIVRYSTTSQRSPLALTRTQTWAILRTCPARPGPMLMQMLPMMWRTCRAADPAGPTLNTRAADPGSSNVEYHDASDETEVELDDEKRKRNYLDDEKRLSARSAGEHGGSWPLRLTSSLEIEHNFARSKGQSLGPPISEKS